MMAPSSLVLREKAGRADVGTITRTFCHANLYGVCVCVYFTHYRSLAQVGIYPPDGKYQLWYVRQEEGGEEVFFFPTVKRVI
jgi:hypothetical protein